MNRLLKNAAGRAAGHAARRMTGDGALLDPRRGWSLLRDREVPVATKLLSLGIGVALTAALAAAELPLETIIGFFLPVFGFGVDLLFDGAEFIAGPILFASLLLPYLHREPAKVMRTVSPSRRPRG